LLLKYEICSRRYHHQGGYIFIRVCLFLCYVAVLCQKYSGNFSQNSVE